MKVLQITTNYPTESNPIFGIFMKEQVDSLVQFGVENTVFFSNGSETGATVKYSGMKVHLKSSYRLFKHLLTHKYDLIHCHSAISGLILILSGGAMFNKCVLSLQNDPEKKGDSDCTFFKILYPFFNKIIVKKKLKKRYRKIVYLPNGCNLNFFHPMNKNECKQKLGLDISKRYILFVDSNTSKKRTQKRKDRFDATLNLLRTEFGYDNIEELVMIGVAREDVPTYINACDLHLLTSDLEGSPNSVKECMCCNVPVVSTDVGNVRDLFDGVAQCYVSDSFEPQSLAFLASKVLNDNSKISTRNAIEQKELDLKSIARKLYNLYLSIINKNVKIF